jgi:hypothetical protein
LKECQEHLNLALKSLPDDETKKILLLRYLHTISQIGGKNAFNLGLEKIREHLKKSCEKSCIEVLNMFNCS